jgi:hypothetical protein
MALAVVLVGCGGSEQKSNVPLIPVIGKVMLDGQPLDEADVNFYPEGDTQGQGGYARTGKDGTYKASTPFGEPGLAAGSYRVVIQKLVTPDGKPFTGSVDPNVPPIEAPYSEVLPPTYSDQTSSILTATVSPESKRPVEFALKSARKKR